MLMQSSILDGRLKPKAPGSSLLRQLWQETKWSVALGWFSGIAVGAFWIYFGMPMICH
jgi:hypothetical protein